MSPSTRTRISIESSPYGLAVFYLSLTPIAIAATAYYLGVTGRSVIRKDKLCAPTFFGRVDWDPPGLASLVTLGRLPFFGPLIWFVAIAFGLGAIIAQGAKALSARPALSA